MELTCPVRGIDSFMTYRGVQEDQVEVILGDDSYIFSDLEELKLWMRRVGVVDHCLFVERFVDLIWNWRLLHFDLRTQHLSIPDLQEHPHRDQPREAPPFRAPRRHDLVGEIDLFDPLHDPNIPGARP